MTYVVFAFDMETDIGSYLTTYNGVRRGTDRILAVLKKHGVPATFLFTGDTALNNRDVVQTVARLGFEVEEGKPVSLDRKLHEMAETLAPRQASVRERQESLALIARWYYSTWRDGEWLAFEDFSAIPYRKMVNAISRVAHGVVAEPQP